MSAFNFGDPTSPPFFWDMPKKIMKVVPRSKEHLNAVWIAPETISKSETKEIGALLVEVSTVGKLSKIDDIIRTVGNVTEQVLTSMRLNIRLLCRWSLERAPPRMKVMKKGMDIKDIIVCYEDSCGFIKESRALELTSKNGMYPGSTQWGDVWTS